MYTAQQIQAYLEAHRDELIECRHQLHRHPEIGLELPKTQAFIVSKLESFGVDEIHTDVADSAVIAVIHGKSKSDKWIGIRADMDALPLKEDSGATYASVVEGRAHSCGHDGHMTVALGVCRFLADNRDFNGTVAVIFQPGEEGFAGSRRLVEAGLFERFPIAEVYAMHGEPDLDLGDIGIAPGYVMASADIFFIDVEGKGGHCARPHEAVDSVLVASQIVVTAQSIISRNVEPLKGGVVSFGCIKSGDESGSSVLPQKAKLVGTCRSFEPEVRNLIEQRLASVAQGVAASLGAQAFCDYRRLYPALLNHTEQAQAVKDIAVAWLGESHVKGEEPQMTAEDFAFMTQKRPGCLFRLGLRDHEHISSLHQCGFDFNDKAIVTGSTLLTATALNRLEVVNA